MTGDEGLWTLWGSREGQERAPRSYQDLAIDDGRGRHDELGELIVRQDIEAISCLEDGDHAEVRGQIDLFISGHR